MSTISADNAARTEARTFRSRFRLIETLIGPDLGEPAKGEASRSINFGWVSALCLVVAAGLLLVVAGQGAGRRGEGAASLLFWSGVILVVVPTTFRISWPMVARGERLFLLFLLAGGLFYYKSVYAPTSFSDHDEFLHWIATDYLTTAGRLFASNPLLDVGPDYPGLQILTSAIVEMTGLPVFVAGTLLLAVLRCVFVGALFLLFESITGSARLSAIACLVYMGCSTYVQFTSKFSYESLGIVLCLLGFAIEAASRNRDDVSRLRAAVLIVVLLAGLAVTHHLSATYAIIYFVAIAILEVLRRDASRRDVTIAAVLALFAVALPLAWMGVRGNPVVNYLGPVIEGGLEALLQRLDSLSDTTRPTDPLGIPPQPLGTRLTTLVAVLLLALGLATGFFRSLALAVKAAPSSGWKPIAKIFERRWRDSRSLFLTVLAFGFPIAMAFRLTVGGWEIGNRMGTFVFFGVGLVVAVSLVHFWQGPAPRGWRRVLPASALAVIVMAGVTASSLNPIRGPYRAGADSESMEPMAIQAARWTREWLGVGNGFIADRVNRLLLAGYGQQDVRVDVVDGVATARIYEAEQLEGDNLYALARSDIDFLLVDMRLSQSRPVFGFYFEPWDSNREALLPEALLKFDNVDGVVRIYDNGWIRIYDVRGLHEPL
ncbi:hypothetical protein [Aurantimonas endophytica]|uniref:Dolichyl-phosphate-mannose-protein mannosyltransferase n=1 Tax=Aurantimonas endophytica TaxID=1522175 RepID=A0A7W6HG64_9HYPH|nr:hypothetical protein [Aurantimonas endophytica]MBB4004407.1 hypothetical protein [Aurantimonas endophytica]MCO6405245.1 hypothetical protein [Aurantimonas endophytica]